MNKSLTFKQFIISQIIILVVGLSLSLGLYYILNQQRNDKSYSSRGGPITTLPTSISLDLTSPDDNLLTFSSALLFSGKTLPHASVLISSQTKDVAFEAKGDGSFSQTITLDEGVNKFNIVVFDNQGEQKIMERTVYYSKEKI